MASDRDRILAAILREALNVKGGKARDVFKRAAVQTGLVESNLSNPTGGDADSAGWRQERASLYDNPTNIQAAARRFRQEFEQHYQPGEKSYDVAAQVQRPAARYRGRYKERASEAESILRSLSGDDVTPRASAAATAPASAGTDADVVRKQALAQYLLTRGQPNALLSVLAAVRSAQQDPSSVKAATPAPTRSPGSGSTPRRSPLLELFWQGPNGINVKNGAKVPQGFVSGHDTHVHVAAGPKTVYQLGKLAQRMGLHVGENSRFTGQRETTGHAPNSHHYSDKAIDVSGDPRKLAEFARRVARSYGVKP
jgi:hypothetical protein